MHIFTDHCPQSLLPVCTVGPHQYYCWHNTNSVPAENIIPFDATLFHLVQHRFFFCLVQHCSVQCSIAMFSVTLFCLSAALLCFMLHSYIQFSIVPLGAVLLCLVSILTPSEWKTKQCLFCFGWAPHITFNVTTNITAVIVLWSHKFQSKEPSNYSVI